MKHFTKIICALLPLLIVLTGCSKDGEITTAGETVSPSEDTSLVTNSSQTTDDSQTEQIIESTKPSIVTEAPAEYDDAWETASMGEQILATDENWSVTGKPVYKDGYMGVDGENMFDVTYLSTVGPAEAYRFEFELNTKQAENDEKWQTLFAGLRIDSEGGIADEDNGIWISFKNGVMGIKGSSDTTWNEGIFEFVLPFSFTDSFRRVCIEDDRAANVINVYQASDNGFNVLVYKLKVNENGENSSVSVFTYEDNFEESIQNISLGFDVSFFNSGYVKLWNHNRAGVYVKNLAMKVI